MPNTYVHYTWRVHESSSNWRLTIQYNFEFSTSIIAAGNKAALLCYSRETMSSLCIITLHIPRMMKKVMSHHLQFNPSRHLLLILEMVFSQPHALILSFLWGSAEMSLPLWFLLCFFTQNDSHYSSELLKHFIIYLFMINHFLL